MNGYSLPTVTANGVTVSKPEEKWIKEEEPTSTCNSRAVNAIWCDYVLILKNFYLSTYTTVKEARDILYTVYEGIDTIK